MERINYYNIGFAISILQNVFFSVIYKYKNKERRIRRYHISLAKKMIICSVCGSKIDDNELICPNCGYDIPSFDSGIPSEKKLMPLSTPLDDKNISMRPVISLLPIQEKTASKKMRIMPEIENAPAEADPDADIHVHMSQMKEPYVDNDVSDQTTVLSEGIQNEGGMINDRPGYEPTDTLISLGDTSGYYNRQTYNVQFAGTVEQVYNVNHDGYYNYIEPVIELEFKDSNKAKILKFLLLVVGLLIIFSMFFLLM